MFLFASSWEVGVVAMDVRDGDPAIFSECPHGGIRTLVPSTNHSGTNNAEPLWFVLMVNVGERAITPLDTL